MFHAFCHMNLQQTVLSVEHEGVGDRFKIQALQVSRGIIFSVVQQSVLTHLSCDLCHDILAMWMWMWLPCNKEIWRLWTEDIRSI